MTFWLTALLVWMASGARIGRVLVKPATTARVAIVIAVAAVALASTIAVPEIGLAADHLAPKGIHGNQLGDSLVVAAWIMFSTATSVVAAAAWPIVSRVNLRQVAWAVYAAGAAAMVLTVLWSLTFGWVVVALQCLFVVITGARNLDWTALGRGIALYTAGAFVVGVLAVLSIRRLAQGQALAAPNAPGWFWPVWEFAALLVAVGAVWIVIELWWRARALLEQIRALHRVLVGRFPEVVVHEQMGSGTQLRASDQVAQIMDALYLQSGGGVETAVVGAPPDSVTERAERVADWVRNPFGEAEVDARWIAPPPGVSPRGWVQAIARAYDAGTPATPSAVERAVRG